MTHILRLADETGATLIDLNNPASTIRLVSYQIARPSTQLAEVRDYLRDGGEVPRIVRDNVTETAVVRITGANPDAVTAQSQVIKRVLIRAERQQSIGITREKRYINFLADGATGNIWRSEILLGDISLPPAGLDWQWANRGVEFTVTWRRRFYWETRDIVNLPLTNSLFIDRTLGQTIYNHNDSGVGHDNYVTIDGSNIDGDLPSPVRLIMQNNFVSSRDMGNMWIGHNVSYDPATMSQEFFAQTGAYWIEAESADTGSTTVANGAASAQNVGRFAWTGSADQVIGTWDLPSSLMFPTKGGRFKMLVRYVGTAPSPTYLHFDLAIRGVTPAYTGASVLIPASEIFDLGSLPLPPWKLSYETLVATQGGYTHEITLRLWAQTDAGGSQQIDLDWIQVTPLDGFHFLDNGGFGVPQSIDLIDDSITGDLYTEGWSPEDAIGNFTRQGAPLTIWPGEDNGYCFVHIDELGDAEADRTFLLFIEHRPRRITV